MQVVLYITTILLAVIITALLVPTIRFMKDRQTEARYWRDYRPTRIHDFGQVKELRILPLIDYYTDNDRLAGEPGVSYLITADDKRILFDIGYNERNEHPSPLLRNMDKLGVSFNDIDSIVISHPHLDHVGGRKAQKNKTFSISSGDIDLGGIKAYVPTQLSHATADVEIISTPRVIYNGIASIGPIHRALWLMGLTPEQSLAINVKGKGKGIIVIVGCGHQTIEKIVQRVKQLFNEPIYGIVGGLHYPVTASRMKHNIQRIFGTGKFPWQRITKTEVGDSVTKLTAMNLKVIGVSAHDSCDWTLNLFREAFGTRYQEIKVGNEIVIT